MKRALLAVLLVTAISIVAASCDATYRLVIPFCPVSDSAWARTDSIPVACFLDTTSQHHAHP